MFQRSSGSEDSGDNTDHPLVPGVSQSHKFYELFINCGQTTLKHNSDLSKIGLNLS